MQNFKFFAVEIACIDSWVPNYVIHRLIETSKNIHGSRLYYILIQTQILTHDEELMLKCEIFQKS